MTETNRGQLPIPFEGESLVDSFKKKDVRKTFHEGEWWFSVKDVLEALTDTTDGTRYSSDLRGRDEGLRSGWAEITRTLPFTAAGGAGGVQNTTFINIEGLFRLMQSLPTTKSEPFKKWLAKVGFERLQEINNPELAIKRAITLYRAKGYDDEWIDARIRNKASRELLTTEWEKSGMADFIPLLTDAISIGTFGIRTAEHKRIKGLKSQSLRDNMSPIELTLTTLGEQATREITKSVQPRDLQQHMTVADHGGRIAGVARIDIEKATGNGVVTSKNYLTEQQRKNNAFLEQKNSDINYMVTRLLQKRKDIPLP